MPSIRVRSLSRWTRSHWSNVWYYQVWCKQQTIWMKVSKYKWSIHFCCFSCLKKSEVKLCASLIFVTARNRMFHWHLRQVKISRVHSSQESHLFIFGVMKPTTRRRPFSSARATHSQLTEIFILFSLLLLHLLLFLHFLTLFTIQPTFFPNKQQPNSHHSFVYSIVHVSKLIEAFFWIGNINVFHSV